MLAAALSSAGCQKAADTYANKELIIFNWEDYLAPDTISGFENETGINVTLYTFDNEDYALSTLQSGKDHYDVVVVSGYLVKILSEQGLLSRIEKKYISNINNIDTEFRSLWYDPFLDYSVPYMWGTTGIAYNTKYINATSPSWSILFDSPPKSRAAMLDDRNEVIGAALFYYNLSTDDLLSEENRKRISSLLIIQKKEIYGYNDVITNMDLLVQEELWAAQVYSGEGINAQAKNPAIDYIIPEEGAFVWVDNLVIPLNSKNKENAHLFIDYVLDARNSAEIANYLYYASANAAAAAFTDKELLENKNIFLENIHNLKTYKQLYEDGNANAAMNKIWSEVQLS